MFFKGKIHSGNNENSAEGNFENTKEQIEGLEKWFNDHLSRKNEGKNNVLAFVQKRIKKIKAESIEKQPKLEDPQLNQEILNNPLYEQGFFFTKSRKN